MKVQGIFTEISSICVSLRQATKQFDRNSISISFVPASYDDQSIKNFLTYCRDGNYSTLNNINKLEFQYHDQISIWWYTSGTFLYSMLNRALRTVEIDTIIKTGIFVHDIHHHIEQLHQEQFSGQEKPQFTDYRSQCLSKVDFEKLLKSRDGLMSFNNFLSTNRDPDMGVFYATTNITNYNVITILLEKTVDPPNPSMPFASVGHVSIFGSENEILFSMHNVFRIENIEPVDIENNRMWKVELKLTSDADQQLSALAKLVREEAHPGSSSWHRMGELLLLLV
ncbi:unnamed protein product [Rotaria socialis]|uniref:Uncharacterized protein n=1 Tax=Rotaria socialis TaxID=392032 RepID=A0A818BXS8_9BILA|nr:unnamed protein product [Rotaria socialis]CAF4351217.1 unnamed protein product [Rotaria socialis]